jgi:hypothetical protein
VSLHHLAGVGTHNATNSFKAYSRPLLEAVGVDTDAGFEMGIEMVAKANRRGERIVEIPTVWLDRAVGQSNINLWQWIPRDLPWYCVALAPARRRKQKERNYSEMSKVLVTGSSGFIGGYLVEAQLDAGHEVVGLVDHSKYGRAGRRYDHHASYRLVERDAHDTG